MKRNQLLFSVFCLLVTSPALVAQQLHTYVDTDSVTVGERFSYTIVFQGSYNSVVYPDESVFEPELELINRERYQLSERRDSLVYHLQFFGTNNIQIGRKEVKLSTNEGDTTLYTAAVPLFFKSVVAEGDEEFRPFKPLFDFARNWFLIFLLLLFLGLALFFLYRWYQNREFIDEKPDIVYTPPKPFVNPLDQLRLALRNLGEPTELSSIEEFEQFYIQLGDAIRAYLKRVYGILALEMTTREIIDALHREIVPSDMITMTRRVLNEADMVKFANFKPSIEQAETVLKRAHSFADNAAIVNDEKIRYMKYKYEEMHGIRDMEKIRMKAE